jgi:hypothetical protein
MRQKTEAKKPKNPGDQVLDKKQLKKCPPDVTVDISITAKKVKNK